MPLAIGGGRQAPIAQAGPLEPQARRVQLRFKRRRVPPKVDGSHARHACCLDLLGARNGHASCGVHHANRCGFSGSAHCGSRWLRGRR